MTFAVELDGRSGLRSGVYFTLPARGAVFHCTSYVNQGVLEFKRAIDGRQNSGTQQ